MLFSAFTQLSLAASTTEHSQAIAMGDFNAADLGMVICYIASAQTITVIIQIGNDMQNWYDKATVSWSATANAVGSIIQASPTTGIGTAFCRLKVTTGSAAAIMAITVNLSRQ